MPQPWRSWLLTIRTSTSTPRISATLPAGEYLLRVRGTGRGDPLGDGYTNYGSLGTYLITGTVSNGVLADRFGVVENSANGTAVGTVAARNNHGGATRSPGPSPAATPAVPWPSTPPPARSPWLTARRSTTRRFPCRWDDPADIELFVTITDAANPALNESIRTVVSVTNVNEAPVHGRGKFQRL